MKKSGKAKPIKIKDIADGKWFTTKFFIRRLPEIIILAVMAVFYIDNGNFGIAQKIEIAKIKQEIQEVKAEALKVEAELTQMGIQSNIEKMVRERGLDIEISQQSKIVIDAGNGVNN
jgi:hypothetical protein